MANLYFEATLDAEQLKKELREVNHRLDGFTNQAKQQGAEIDATFKRIGAAMAGYFSITAAKGFVDQMIQVRGEFQQLEIAMESMIGNKARADQLMSDVIEMAAKTPFSLAEVGQGAKQLLAVQEPVDEVMNSLRQLGDISAGLSVPLSQLIKAYGDVRAKGRLMGQEMLQFMNAGVPIVAELAKHMDVAESEVSDLVAKGKVGFNDLKAVISNLSDEGGMFYNLMEKQSASLTGRLSNLGDSWEQMLNKLGESNEGILYGGISALNSMVENYETVLDVLKAIVVTYGAYKGAVVLLHMAEKARNISGAISAWFSLAKGIKTAKDAQLAFNLATKMNPLGLAAAGVAALVAAITIFANKTKSAQDIIAGLNESVSKFSDSGKEVERLAGEYETLRGKAERTKDENDRLNTVMEALSKSVPGVVTEFDEYGRALDVNIEKVREFSEAQKEAAKIQLTKQIEEAEKAVEKLDKKLAPLQRVFQEGITSSTIATATGGTRTIERRANEDEIAEAAERANKIYSGREQILESISQAQKALNNLTAEPTKTEPQKTEEEDPANALEEFKKGLEERKKAYDDYNDAVRNARIKDIDGIKEYYKDLIAQGNGYEEYLKNQLLEVEGNVEKTIAVYQAAAKAKIVINEPKKIKRRPIIGTLSVAPSVAPSTKDMARLREAQEKYNAIYERIRNVTKNQQQMDLAGNMIEAAYAAQDLASAVGQIDAELGAAMNGIADAVGQVGNILKLEAGGDTFGVVTAGLNGALQVAGMLVNSAKQRQAAEEAFYRSIRSQQQDYNLALNEQLRLQTELSEGIFLTDYAGRMGDAMASLSDATKEYYKIEGDLAKGQAKVGQRNAVDWGNVGTGAAGGAAAGAAIGSIIPVIGTAIGAVVGGIGGAIAGLFGGKKKKDTYASLLQEYPELLDRTKEGADRFNDSLAETLIKNETVKGDTKEILENLVEWKNAAKAAEEQIAQISKDLVGMMGDDLKNSLVSAFEEGENAAKNFGDSVESILEDMIAEQAMQAVFGNLFNQFEQDFADAYASDGYKGAMPLMTDLMDDAIGMQEDFNKFIEEAKKKGNAKGLSLFDGSASQDPLTGAIKGVSEETASLIGGQMNAIRINQAESLRLMNESARYWAEIAANTSYNRYLEGIHSDIKAMRSAGSDLKAKGF